jgi:adenine C2-methylase RlmN of 23S rRNA A2503 and tRNA A37
MNRYIKFHRTDDPVEIHYTLINGVNDSDEELKQLCNKLQKYNIPIKFIRFNPVNELKSSKKEEIWIKRIREECSNLRIKTYSPPGREIGSSCGEFTKHYYHSEIETKNEYEEFVNWKKNHRVE